MSKLVWDQTGERFYETGVRNVVLYVQNSDGTYGKGVAWNGVTGITESPSGAEATALYADDIKYLNLISNEEFGATIEAYTYPDEFAECDGSANIFTGITVGQQARKAFGLCYRTAIGSDTDGNDHGYKLHIIYGCKATPSEKAYATINDSPEAITFSWELSTTPVSFDTKSTGGTTLKPTATITIDSTKVNKTNMDALEAYLYGVDASSGTSASDPGLPLPDTLVGLLTAQN